MNKIRQLVLLVMASMMSVAYAQGGVEALNLHLTSDGGVQSTLLENFQRITFSGDNLVVRTISDGDAVYPLANVQKITFGDYVPLVPTDFFNPAAQVLDISVYATPQGDVVVTTPLDVLSLAVYDLSGRQLCTGAQINISALPQSVYLLQITTDQGVATKKIIKK
jgi:hypothetical protein